MAALYIALFGVGALAWSKYQQRASTALKEEGKEKPLEYNEVLFGHNHNDYNKFGNPKHPYVPGVVVRRLGKPTLGLQEDLQLINPVLHNKTTYFKNTKRGMENLNFARQLATETHGLLDERIIGRFGQNPKTGGILKCWNPTIVIPSGNQRVLEAGQVSPLESGDTPEGC